MEQRMKESIKENLPQLIELTNCSAKFLAIFLSRSILSKCDVQLINAQQQNEGKLAASAMFYDFVTSRSGSSDVLLEALKETTQTGALNVLTFSSKNENSDCKQEKQKFSSQPPNYIMDYIKQQDKQYLIVSSDDCKLTCDRILESTPNCKFYSITELLDAVSSSPISSGSQVILLTNLGKNLDPIYSIELNTRQKVVFVTSCDQDELQGKLLRSTLAWKIVKDRIEWSDLSSQTRFGITSSLKKSLGLDGHELINALSEINSKILIDLLNDNFHTPKDLFCDSIPLPISYYVSRTLQTRYVISNTIFEELFFSDLVLFVGIERFVLSEICPKKLIESSTNLLRNKRPTSQFVCLDNEMDFDKVTIAFPRYAVHLLEYENVDFIWRKSSRNVFSIRRHIAAQQQTLSESEFVSKILAQTNTSPVCISDTPGKGKSILLAKLARKAKHHYKTGIVAFIIIKDLIQQLKQNQPVSPITVFSNISRFISTSSLGSVYLNANKNYLRELFLDGIDEIDADDTDFAFECIREIRTVFNETRIWITSRPHIMPLLENALETLGYNITPFSKPDQILFLSSFWSFRIERCNAETFNSFADNCLKTLETSLGPTNEDIAGIPLQCLLIGEAFEEDAKRFLRNSSSNVVISQVITSVADLYHRLIEKKKENFLNRYNYNNLGISEIYRAHMYMALEILHPSHVTKFSKILGHSMSRQEILDFGIIEAKSVLASFDFLHRTFAEYFVAIFASEFYIVEQSEVFSEFLFTNLLMTDKNELNHASRSSEKSPMKHISFVYSKFRHNVTCYFLNVLLESSDLKPAQHFSCIDVERVRSIADACVYHNLENLFLKLIYLENMNESTGLSSVLSDLSNKQLKVDVVTEDLIVKAVYRTDVHFLSVLAKEFVSLNGNSAFVNYKCNPLIFVLGYFQDSGSFKRSESSCDQTINLDDENLTLLHLAMRKADYSKVNYLISNHFWESVEQNDNGMYNNLIYLMLENTTSYEDWVVTDQKLIVNYLARLNGALLIFEDENGCFPLEAKDSHVDLVLEVWKLAKNFYTKVNIFHQISQTFSIEMSCENFHKFLKAAFADLEKSTIQHVICKGNLWTNISSKDGLTIEYFNFLKDQCSSLSGVNSIDRCKAFVEASSCQEENILLWLLNNLPYTSQDIRDLLNTCLDRVYEKGVNALLSSAYITLQKGSHSVSDFTEIFQFLFTDNSPSSPDDVFSIVHLVNYFLWKSHFNYFETTDFETTLTDLIKVGSSYFENLSLNTLVNKVNRDFLKLVWITSVLSNLKKPTFRSQFKSYLLNIGPLPKDSYGNTLLHIFAQNIDSAGLNKIGRSFFNKIQFSKAFKNMCCNLGDIVRASDIWEVLIENQSNILQLNTNNQSPICILSRNKDHLGCYQYITNAILFAGKYLTIQDNWNIDNIHKVFYFTIKSHDKPMIEKVYEWYTSICESRNVDIAKVTVNIAGQIANFLDAAVRNGDGNVLEFVINVLQIHIPLRSAPLLCVHNSIQPEHYRYWYTKSAKYIEHLAEIFPNEITTFVNQTNERNVVPLSLAAKLDSDIVKVLLNLGADINAADDDGNTPLHFLLMHQNFQLNVVQQIIHFDPKNNAERFKMGTQFRSFDEQFNIRSRQRLSDLDNGTECFKILLESKANPCIKDNDGNTIVHKLFQRIVSGKKIHRVVESLISNGFGDVLRMQNKHGQTPLKLAEEFLCVHENTRQLLLEKGTLKLEI